MFCEFCCHTCVPISSACKKRTAVSHSSTKNWGDIVEHRSKNMRIIFVEVVGYCACQSGYFSRQLKPITMNASQESSDRTTPHMAYTSFLSASILSVSKHQVSIAVEILQSNRGLKTKSSGDTSTSAMLKARVWHARHFQLNTDSGFVNFQNQHRRTLCINQRPRAHFSIMELRNIRKCSDKFRDSTQS